jgi:hypothetical protein
MVILRHAPELAWRCDGCQQGFEVGYDDQTGQETNLPTLVTARTRRSATAAPSGASGPARTSPSRPP